MTDLYLNQNDDYLVVVNAQVMIRDENKGGWVPLGRGGLSQVCLRRRLHRSRCGDESRNEYRIQGMLDQSEVLNCLLTKDVKYIIANPTFIHWHTEEKKFGLTFQSHHDAEAFKNGVQQVVEDLLQGNPHKNAIHNLQQMPPRPERTDRQRFAGEEENVFMALDLPLARKGSGSTVSTATTTTTSSPQSPALHSLHEGEHPGNGDVAPSPSHVLKHLQAHLPPLPPPHAIDRAPSADEPVMHKVVYMNPRSGNKNSPNHSSGKSSTKSHSSMIPDPLEDVWVRKENQANNERAHQMALHGFAYEKGAPDDIDLDMDSSSCSYVQFNHGNVPSSFKQHAKLPHTTASPFSSSVHESPAVPTAATNPLNHDYSYPSFDSHSNPSRKQSFSCSPTFAPSQIQHAPSRPDSIRFKGVKNRPRFPSPQQPQLPTKKQSKKSRGSSGMDRQSRSLLHSGARAHCKYCDEMYTVDENPRGACKDAPDAADSCIQGVTCMRCARCLLYHCVSKEENYDNPFHCDSSDENHCKKWTVLTILTLFVPCLWCYCVLRACHRCGTACGCCGGRHRSS